MPIPVVVPTIDYLVDVYLQKYDRLRGEDVMEDYPYNKAALHCSMLGTCHRESCLSQIGAARLVRDEQTERNKRRKFELAHHVHNLIYAALKDAGYLHDCELDLSPYLPDGWDGRADFLDLRYGGMHLHLGDVKSQHPNAIRHADSLPKHFNKLQVTAYYIALKALIAEHPEYFAGGRLMDTGTIAYFDRGGGNTPQECVFEFTDELIAECRKEMETIDFEVREAKLNGILPPVMPRDMKFKSYKRQIVFDTHWQCNPEYCDFIGVSCTPEQGQTTLAVLEDGLWTTKAAGRRYAEQIEEFLEAETEKELLAAST